MGFEIRSFLLRPSYLHLLCDLSVKVTRFQLIMIRQLLSFIVQGVGRAGGGGVQPFRHRQQSHRTRLTTINSIFSKVMMLYMVQSLLQTFNPTGSSTLSMEYLNYYKRICIDTLYIICDVATVLIT